MVIIAIKWSNFVEVAIVVINLTLYDNQSDFPLCVDIILSTPRVGTILPPLVSSRNPKLPVFWCSVKTGLPFPVRVHAVNSWCAASPLSDGLRNFSFFASVRRENVARHDQGGGPGVRMAPELDVSPQRRQLATLQPRTESKRANVTRAGSGLHQLTLWAETTFSLSLNLQQQV